MDTVKLVIFDLDGTLFRTETVDVEAFNKALASMGYKEREAEEILGLIGLTMNSICEVLLDSTEDKLVNIFKELVIKNEDEAIEKSGLLYEGTLDFLTRLKNKGYTLCICSNGNEEYVTSISRKFGFFSIFDEIWFERKGISKAQAVGLLKEKFRAEIFIMVGDRDCDIDAGRCNGGRTIGVTYGFGGEEADAADYKAGSIAEVERLIYKVFDKL